MTNPLDEMTQAKWDALSDAQRAAIRSDAGLTPALIGHEGQRVEATRRDGSTVRFWVGRSTGWIPCHLEIQTPRFKRWRSG